MFENAPQNLPSLPKWKRNRMSYTPQSSTTDYSNYRQTKRIGRSPKEYPENEASKFMMDDVIKHHFLWCLMRHNSLDSSIPSWMGFQILMWQDSSPYIQYWLPWLHRCSCNGNFNNLPGKPIPYYHHNLITV